MVGDEEKGEGGRNDGNEGHGRGEEESPVVNPGRKTMVVVCI